MGGANKNRKYRASKPHSHNAPERDNHLDSENKGVSGIAKSGVTEHEHCIPESANSLTAIALSLNALIAEYTSDKQGTEVFQSRSLFVQWLLFLATSAAFVAAVGYAWIAYGQWHDAHIGFQDARTNFLIEQRAWLKVNQTFPTMISSTLPAVVTTINFGKSVASKIMTTIAFEVVPSSSDPSFNLTNEPLVTTTPFLPPNDNIVLEVHKTPLAKDRTPQVLTDDQINSLDTGTSYIAVFGITTYNDPFGPHWIRFCAWKTYVSAKLIKSKVPTFKTFDFRSRSCTDWNTMGDGVSPTH